MRARRIALLFVLASSTGCGGAFALSGPAHYEVPSARAATLITSSATVRKYEVASADGALVEARPTATGTLLDFVKLSPDGSFGVKRECGTLTMADAATGAAHWKHARDGYCVWPVFETTGGLVTLEDRHSAAGAKGGWQTILTRLDPATGQARATATTTKKVSSVAPFGDDLVTMESDATSAAIVLRAGDSFAPRWTLALEASELSSKIQDSKGKPTTVRELRQVVAGPDAIYVVGTRRVLTIDPRTGQRRATAQIASKEALTATPFAGGAIVSAPQGDDEKPFVTAIGADGTAKWNARGMTLGLAHGDAAVLISDEEVALVRTADGATTWRAKLGAPISGRPVFAGNDKLVLVPQRLAVVALDAATGNKAFEVPADSSEALIRHLDQLIVDDANGLVVWDSWRHVTAFDMTGAVRYRLHVRSLPIGHREERSVEANADVPVYHQKFDSAAIITSNFGVEPNGMQHSALTTSDGKINMGGLGMSGAMTVGTLQMSMAMSDYANEVGQINANNMFRTIGERRNAQFAVAQRESAMNERSPFLVRPITWNLGRGYLVVRKTDGAFAEVVTGPSDLYEDKFRESSMGYYDANAGVVLAFTEGTNSAAWELAEETPPVQLVKRKLMGFPLAADAFRPANTYATTSKVPDGSFTWPLDLQ